MNVQQWAILSKCAKYRKEKMQIHSFSTSNVIYQAWRGFFCDCCLHLYLICLQGGVSQPSAVHRRLLLLGRWGGIMKERVENAFLTLVSTFLLWWKKNEKACTSHIQRCILGFLEFRADLEPRMRCQAARWSLIRDHLCFEIIPL